MRLSATLIVTALLWAAAPPARALPQGAITDAELAAMTSAGARPTHAGPRLVLDARDEDGAAAADTLTGRRYRSAALGYVRETGAWRLRFVVRCATPEDLPAARSAASFLGAVWHAAANRFGTLCSRLRERPLDVWLSRSGAAGGHNWRTSIYIDDIGAARTGLEWARELAHEYGHYLLPSASGYTAPESWANGVLGERLFLGWLLEDARAGADALPYVGATELAYYAERQATPLIERADAAATLALDDPGKAGFDTFTALMLQASDAYGPPVLMNLLECLPQARSQPARGPDFERALAAWLDQSERFETRIPAPGRRIVYLPRGVFRVRAAAGSAAGMAVAGVQATVSDGGWTVRIARGRRLAIAVSGSQGNLRLEWTRQ